MLFKKISDINLWLVLLMTVGSLGLTACGNANASKGNEAQNAAEAEKASVDPYKHSKAFNDYWYQGKAELNSYDLKQARYGEMRNGDAVLVFVTENLSLKNHIKHDAGKVPTAPVLKLNFTKDFVTGIYPYHMMKSVFTPVDVNTHPRSLRVTTSSQEWCGHTFTRVDLEGKEYEVEEHSYFPNEGDTERKIKAVWLEDEILTLIRIAPETLPEGEISMIPSSFASRMRHEPLKPEKAMASLSTGTWNGKKVKTWKVEYPAGNRTYAVHFQDQFPYVIEGWEETYRSGWGASAKELTTTATRKGDMMLDYWSRNGTGDIKYREELKLE